MTGLIIPQRGGKLTPTPESIECAIAQELDGSSLAADVLAINVNDRFQRKGAYRWMDPTVFTPILTGMEDQRYVKLVTQGEKVIVSLTPEGTEHYSLAISMKNSDVTFELG